MREFALPVMSAVTVALDPEPSRPLAGEIDSHVEEREALQLIEPPPVFETVNVVEPGANGPPYVPVAVNPPPGVTPITGMPETVKATLRVIVVLPLAKLIASL